MQIRYKRGATAALAISTMCVLAAFDVQAFQGEQNPLPPLPFESNQTRAEVRAQAMKPMQISNGGAAVIARVNEGDRAEVRAGARAIAPKGTATYGDTTFGAK